MINFDDAFAALIGIEGGYSNNSADPGGETMYGITKRVAMQNGYTGDMRLLQLEQAKSIAKKCYWDLYQCDQFDIRIGYQIFDTAYNGGHPAQWLQAAAGVTVDGAIGAQTISAVRGSDPLKIVMRFCANRARYYSSLNNMTFINGWVNRLAKNLDIGAA
ncbi:Phage protein [Collimonas arenae]|uniref:Phage protein n=1 Tax=Collimonas arenae TaxID=279058 RepID=A0A0A1FBI7_9BURK|nr:glycosyl hydrolase 108 family protein [Collimonas arenae]AIY40197.1 Phage protein [Collimonas arenae]